MNLPTLVSPPPPGGTRPPLTALPLYSMSPTKLVLMATCTFGLYHVYWFYRNWRLLRREGGENIWPLPRAFFAGLTAYFLFEEVEEFGRRTRVPIHWSAGFLGLAFFLINAAWRLPDPYWLIAFLAPAPLVPVQRSINEINARAEEPKLVDAAYSGWNYAAIFLGGLFLLLVLMLMALGMYLPAE